MVYIFALAGSSSGFSMNFLGGMGIHGAFRKIFFPYSYIQTEQILYTDVPL